MITDAEGAAPDLLVVRPQRLDDGAPASACAASPEITVRVVIETRSGDGAAEGAQVAFVPVRGQPGRILRPIMVMPTATRTDAGIRTLGSVPVLARPQRRHAVRLPPGALRRRPRRHRWVDLLLIGVCGVIWMGVIWRMHGTSWMLVHGTALPRADMPAPRHVIMADQPFALYAPPSITAAQYRRFWEQQQHPMADHAEEIYDLLVAAGIDPAIHAVIASVDAAEAGDLGWPPPRGQYNVHRVGRRPCWGCAVEPLRFPNYASAVTAWIRTLSDAPASPATPLTLETLVVTACQAPSCDVSTMQRALRQMVLELRRMPP